MGLLRGVARTAVVAGTATAVSNRVSRRQAGRWAAQEQQAAPPQDYPPQQQYAEPPPQQYAPPPPEPAGEADGGVDLDALKQLGELRDAGVLTEAEFQVQKERILAR
ncbi:putative oligomerization/nucleic acid binding protein [Humibacillus xanthopallidus]|uniref:Putative oligomerization/nucleic acid binding protein n=1 Tax=Humibacillus xanthopallidus TaxID=412689 RepID=A0A543PUK0_9MICO|nr:SHOCT domain-containing protein [Humibacillus xanthopallidus]TQN47757.1 putative oligomerization/nucleic acid binding protein [Humibacillus xanthopallidus]